MSNFKVPYTQVLEVSPHTNAERLELVRVYDFQVVAPKGRYHVGDYVLYSPVDSVLDTKIEKLLFPEGSKVKLKNSRVRQIRLRGFASQGMIIDPNVIREFLPDPETTLVPEDDYSAVLGISKYEPEFGGIPGEPGAKTLRNRPLENPRFHQYNGVDNIKWYPSVFEGEEVVVQEKLHGSNCRSGLQPTVANTLWKRIKRFFGLLPKYEFVYGSNKVQLQERSGYTGYYGSDVYGEVLKKVKAFDKLKPGETVYGELIGPGIQKGYTYGHDEHNFVVFDIKLTDEDGNQFYLDPEQAETFAKDMNFDFAPVLYKGPYNKELIESLVTGPSVYCPEEKVREGIVIKARTGYDTHNGKRAYKWINPEYLDDSTNTDLH